MVFDFNKKYMYIAVDIENNFIESTRWINTNGIRFSVQTCS